MAVMAFVEEVALDAIKVSAGLVCVLLGISTKFTTTIEKVFTFLLEVFQLCGDQEDIFPVNVK